MLQFIKVSNYPKSLKLPQKSQITPKVSNYPKSLKLLQKSQIALKVLNCLKNLFILFVYFCFLDWKKFPFLLHAKNTVNNTGLRWKHFLLLLSHDVKKAKIVIKEYDICKKLNKSCQQE